MAAGFRLFQEVALETKDFLLVWPTYFETNPWHVSKDMNDRKYLWLFYSAIPFLNMTYEKWSRKVMSLKGLGMASTSKLVYRDEKLHGTVSFSYRGHDFS